MQGGGPAVNTEEQEGRQPQGQGAALGAAHAYAAHCEKHAIFSVEAVREAVALGTTIVAAAGGGDLQSTRIVRPGHSGMGITCTVSSTRRSTDSLTMNSCSLSVTW